MRLETVERGKRRAYTLLKPVTLAGRDLACDISIASASVSRRHAEFLREGGTLRVNDLGSRNGIRVNGKPVPSAVLAEGDRVQIGEAEFVFRTGGAAPAESPAPAAPPETSVSGDAPTPLDLSFSASSLPAVPAPASGPAAPEAAPAPAKPPVPAGRRRLLWGVGAAALLSIAGSVGWRFLKPPPPPPSAEYGIQDYARDVQEALDGFEAFEKRRREEGMPVALADLQAVRVRLQGIHAKLPQTGLAALLDRAMAFHECLKEDYRTFPHQEACAAWDAVKKVKGLDPRVEVFVSQRLKWMEGENEALLALQQAKDLAQQGKRDAAIAAFGRIPPETLAHPEAVKESASLLAQAFQEQIALADRAEAARGWEGALTALQAAEPLARGPEQEEAVRVRRERIQAVRAEEGILRAGEKAYREGRVDEARNILAQIPQGSAYRAPAEQILAQIRRQESMADLNACFAAGRAEEALLKLDSLPEGVLDARGVQARKDLYRGVLAGVQSGRAHAAGGRLPEAVAAWRTVADLLKAAEHKDNVYRREAEAYLAQWGTEAIAAHYLAQAKQCVGKQEYAKARELLDLARKADPKTPMGEDDVMKPILNRVGNLRMEASHAARAQNDPDRAITLLRSALEMIRPGDGAKAQVYEGVVRELRELGVNP